LKKVLWKKNNLVLKKKRRKSNRGRFSFTVQVVVFVSRNVASRFVAWISFDTYVT